MLLEFDPASSISGALSLKALPTKASVQIEVSLRRQEKNASSRSQVQSSGNPEKFINGHGKYTCVLVIKQLFSIKLSFSWTSMLCF